MLLTQDELLASLKQHLSGAERVDIAMAWASPGEALAEILTFAKDKPGCLRSIIGTAGNATDPTALRQLQAQGKLRVPDSTPLFHPKLILFHRAERVTVWVGSANLTRCGFQQNTEVMAEFEDDGTAVLWFNKLWDHLDDDCSAVIKEYENAWQPTSFPTRKAVGSEKPLGENEFVHLKAQVSDWPSFVVALKAANRYWPDKFGASVDGETASWLNTITLGNEVVRRDNWDDLSKTDYRLIMGIGVEGGDAPGYGLLGSMQGAGDAKNVFNKASRENLKIRADIRNALQPVIIASRADFSNSAIEFIRYLKMIRGFSGAIATRLLALARPDLAVSVNAGSRVGLATLSKLPPNSLSNVSNGPRARSYADLLTYLSLQQWYSNPTPNGAYEQTLANARAALLDCLVYRPVEWSDDR
jgi:HKD family nuclease